ncbi:MAG: hypothetical protein M3024_03070 [Candidatus Dormibacteraeota bacterium]|nr:hypothetical protein [Candidatus Dormibacteraeota bacterium]
MNPITVGLIALIAILGGFYAGTKVGESRAPATAAAATTGLGGARGAGTGATPGTGTAGGGAALGNAIAGRVVSVSGNIVTITNRTTGKTEKVDVTSARITKSVSGTASDVQANQNVTIVGPAGADGTVQAQVVAIGGGFGGGRSQPTASPAG